MDDGLQHDIRVDAVVWGEESGRGSVSGLEGGVGDVDHRPASRDVEDRDGGDAFAHRAFLLYHDYRDVILLGLIHSRQLERERIGAFDSGME